MNNNKTKLLELPQFNQRRTNKFGSSLKCNLLLFRIRINKTIMSDLFMLNTITCNRLCKTNKTLLEYSSSRLACAIEVI